MTRDEWRRREVMRRQWDEAARRIEIDEIDRKFLRSVPFRCDYEELDRRLLRKTIFDGR